MKGKTLSNGFGLCALFILIAGSLMLAMPGSVCGAAKAKGDDVLIRWGDQVITKAEVDLRIQAFSPEMQEQLKDPKQMRHYLDSLIQIKTVGAEARAQKLDKEKRVAIRLMDTADSILLQEYMNAKIKKLPPPTEAECKAFYDKHKEEFMTPAFVRARHILIESKPDTKPEDVARAKAKAEALYQEILAGGNFEKLAEQHSEDHNNKKQGGDLGLFQFEQMVPEFSGPVFKMKKGELGKPFLTPFGFHIVRVEDVVPSKQMAFSEVKENVTAQVDNENRDRLIESELERLKKKYKATIVEKKK